MNATNPTNRFRMMIDSAMNVTRKLVTRSQQYTGTDNTYVARGGFWISLGFSFNTLLSLGLVLAFANFLPKESYGTYKYILSIAGFFGFLTLTGMNTAVSQMVAKGSLGVFPYSIRVQLRWNLLYVFAGLVTATYYAFQENLLLAGGIGILAITFPLYVALNTFGAYLNGRREFKRATRYGTIMTFSQSAFILTALIFWPNILVLVTAYIIGLLLPTAWFCVQLLRTAPKSVSPTEVAALNNYAGHLTIMNVLSTADSYLDKILLFQNVGAVQVASYSLALAAPERIRGYIKSLGTLLLPRLAERSLTDIRRVYYIRLGQGFLIGAAIAGAYWVVAPILFTYFLPQYTDAITVSRMLGLANIFTISGTYMAGVFRSQRMVRALYLSSVGGHSFRIALYAILTPLYGVWGLVAATLGTYMLGTFYNSILWEYESRRLLRAGQNHEESGSK